VKVSHAEITHASTQNPEMHDNVTHHTIQEARHHGPTQKQTREGYTFASLHFAKKLGL
jgi:hypothetical protein